MCERMETALILARIAIQRPTQTGGLMSRRGGFKTIINPPSLYKTIPKFNQPELGLGTKVTHSVNMPKVFGIIVTG